MNQIVQILWEPIDFEIGKKIETISWMAATSIATNGVLHNYDTLINSGGPAQYICPY